MAEHKDEEGWAEAERTLVLMGNYGLILYQTWKTEPTSVFDCFATAILFIDPYSSIWKFIVFLA